MSVLYNIESLAAQNDLIVLAERAGANFRKTGGAYRSHCPIHGGNNPNAFAVWEKDGKQWWKCFTKGCGQGDVIDFVEIWQQKTFKDAVRFLGGETIADPIEMERLARERHERAVKERREAQAKEEARRKELQAEQKHVLYHQNMNVYFVDEWNKRGLNECWQNFFFLGGCPDFVIEGGYHTPTLTIPIKDEGGEIVNIKHRLLNPRDPKDKYRPEKPGLGLHPFMAFPDMAYNTEKVWILEGEIKSMVTASITPESTWQFIGVPGVMQFKMVSEKVKGKDVVVVADPGAEDKAQDFCKSVNGRFFQPADKIDDMIVAHGYDGDWLRSIEKQARRVK